MKMNEISVEEAVESAKRYKYALIYEISDMYFGSTEAMKVLDLSECIEAFFFDETGEIHIYHTEDGIRAMEYIEEADNTVIEKLYATNKYRGEGVQNVIVREYLEADEDGQMCVVFSRLAGVR